MGVTPTWITSCRSRTAEKIRTRTCRSCVRPAMGARRETSNDGKGSRKRALAWWLCNHRCSVKRNASVACVRLSLRDAVALPQHSVANADQKLVRVEYIKLTVSSAAGPPGRGFRRTSARRHAITRGKVITLIRNRASNAGSNLSARNQTRRTEGHTVLLSAGEKRGAKKTRVYVSSAMFASGDAKIQKTKTYAAQSSAPESEER